MKKAAFSFDESSILTSEQIGAKALNLLRLRNRGFNVPDGFCLTCHAYQAHMQQFENDINSSHADLGEIRNIIFEKPIHPDIAADIEMCYQHLSNPVVAIRSSATAEDLPGHSFAGQYESYLDVESFAGCLEAIKQCWGSLWSDRAYSYREKNGIDHFHVKMAVIVQEMVAADVAGVMFTADPLRGQTDRIVIEACRGSGEALVSGRVTPDNIIFSKKNTKPIWILPADMSEPACLSLRMGRRLAKAGKKIEKLYGYSQDIEWAIANKKIYFLQTRPVTTQPVHQSWEDRQIWTNINTGEVAPDVVTPLDGSFLAGSILPLFEKLFYILSIELGKVPFFDVAAGRLYFNFNTGMAFITKLPSFLMKPRKTNVLFGGGDERQYDLRAINFGPDDLPDLKVSIWRILWRAPYSLYQFYQCRYSNGLKAFGQLKQHARHFQSIPFNEKTTEELAALLREIPQKAVADFNFLHLTMATGPSFFVMILCERWMNDENRKLANLMLKSAGNMADVEAGVAMMELAQLAQQDTQVCEILQSGQDWATVKKQFVQFDSGKAFITAWDEFMIQYGHHCRGEILLSNPRWSERPDYVLQMVKGCLNPTKLITPGQRYSQNVQDQEEAIEQTLKQLKNPLKRWYLRKQVRKAQLGLALRENHKSELVCCFALLRYILLIIGKRLQESGLFIEADDIFFLKHEELHPVIAGKFDFNIQRTIQQRRQEYERYKAVDPPQVIIGRFDPDNYIPPSVDMDMNVFSGMSTCPGRVTGKARVILRSDEAQQVLPGEILVAPFTDPGWTPYFVNAAGIVMDQGGLLSHGSIVAREYGIPAVVNVGPATKIIKTGQLLDVDANQGIVKILS